TLHEALAVFIQQDTAFTAHAFGNQHASTGNASGVELPEFHVLQRQTGTRSHTQAVTGVDEGVGGSSPDTASTTGSQHHALAFQNVDFAGFHFQSGYAQNVASFVTQQIQSHPFHEELGTGSYVTLVQGVQHGVTSTVSSSTGTLNRFFTEVGGVTTKWTLVNRAVLVTVKRHTEVLKLVHSVWSF